LIKLRKRAMIEVLIQIYSLIDGWMDR